MDFLLISSENGYQSLGKSVAALGELLVDDLSSSGNVLVSGQSVLSDVVHDGGGELVALGGPLLLWLSELISHRVDWVLGPDSLRDLSELSPGLLTQWLLEVLVKLVDGRVPKSVELIDVLLLLKHEEVATHVSVGELLGESADSVKWLMNITNIMDEKSQVESITKIPLDSMIWVSFVGFELLCHVVNGPGDIVCLWVDRLVEALVKERLIDEMPRGLVIESLVFDVIGEGGTLDKHVLVFVLVHISKWLQVSLSLWNDARGDLLKVVVSNTRS